MTATAKVGQGEVSETFTIAAGETIEKDLIAGVGRVVVNAAYVEGMKVEDGGLGVNVVKATASIDGSREEVGYGFGPDTGYDLPPGDYIAIVNMDDATAEVPFSIEAGKSVEVVGVLNAGVVAITAAGTEGLNIYSGKADIQGNRKEFGYSYDEEYQQTLSAGKYVVVAHFPDDVEKEVPFTVVAGERVEVTVE